MSTAKMFWLEGAKLRSQGNFEGAEETFKKGLEAPGSVVDHHFVKAGLIELYFRWRETNPQARDLCIQWCEDQLAHLEEFKVAHREQQLEELRRAAELPAARREDKKMYEEARRSGKHLSIPGVLAVKRLADLYAEEGDYDAAIAVCERALEMEAPIGSPGEEQERIEEYKRLKAQQP